MDDHGWTISDHQDEPIWGRCKCVEGHFVVPIFKLMPINDVLDSCLSYHRVAVMVELNC